MGRTESGVRRLRRKKTRGGRKKRTSSAKAQTHFQELNGTSQAVPSQKLSDRKLFQQSKTGQAPSTRVFRRPPRKTLNKTSDAGVGFMTQEEFRLSERARARSTGSAGDRI